MLKPVVPARQGKNLAGDTVSGVCQGTLGELYQGPLRAGTDPEIAVVSFPVDRHSWVYFSPGTAAGPPGPHPPPLKEKSATAARLFLDHYGLALPPGDWLTHSELPVGVGMASSTADIVATLRCLFRVFSLPYATEVALGILAEIERADSVFLDEFALYLSGRHQVVRRLGRDVGFHTAFVTEAGTVDTAAVTPLLLDHYRRRGEEYQGCLTDLLKGFDSGDRPAVARAATISAALSQEVLPKATFSTLQAHRERFGADGVFVAHTGCLVGYLFASRPQPDVKSDLSAFFHSLGHQCTFAQGGYG
ncbi:MULTISPECIES: GHMP family kinase ATP-binding protein [Streptomyces]|uniref:GHMP family kinase ATP-binding protein n=1 Tax=Streptomyces TaxID=1883 RepID=UPI00332A5C05